MKALAHEVANAARVLDNDLPAKQGRHRQVGAVIDEAKRLQRLQTKLRRLRAQVRTCEADIRHSKKMLKALAGDSTVKV